ncbi:MAG: hypothetical protein KAT79_06510, partial [candidate division Zixibacteria bacterium]|nr:hypothetical protein [candidate division Zixibacteria bacterium]
VYHFHHSGTGKACLAGSPKLYAHRPQRKKLFPQARLCLFYLDWDMSYQFEPLFIATKTSVLACWQTKPVLLGVGQKP